MVGGRWWWWVVRVAEVLEVVGWVGGLETMEDQRPAPAHRFRPAVGNLAIYQHCQDP